MNPNYFSIITAKVRYDKNLTPNAKLLYAEITSLSNKDGYCWASNKYFAELYSVSERTVSSWIKNLIDEGHLSSSFIYKKGTKEIEKRCLSCIEKNFYTYGNNLPEGIEENFRDNNTSINNKDNSPSFEKSTESNQLLIDQTEPESFNPLHFFIAKSYHNFFLKSKGKIRTLTKVETKSYVKTIRLMLDNDGVTVEQMIAVKMFLDDSIAEGSRLDSFWANTIYSMATLREKKNDVYRWDMIKKQTDEWGKIEGNVSRVSKAHKQLMEKVERYAGV